MPRKPRSAFGGVTYHVLNRAVGRQTLFESDGDYRAFGKVFREAVEREVKARRTSPDVLAWCLMPNHWHLVLRPHGDEDLSNFMRWLTVTHTQRYHAAHRTSGTGPLYQGRFKSFPIEEDVHLTTVLRYVERNALRAKLAERAETWPWGSASDRNAVTPVGPPLLSMADWPVERQWTPGRWRSFVNRPQSDAEEAAIRTSITRGRPFGGEPWQQRTAERHGLAHTFRKPGRPRKIAG
ncbi:MAG: transposase [Planctomycetota bacterium]